MGRRPEPDDIHHLVGACAAADAVARRRFQEHYAEDIYNFPVKIYGVPAERAADFYVYVFERDRIFTRMRTFEGRNGIQFRTFLAYYVLRSLFLEWQRGDHSLDTVSLSDDRDAPPEPRADAVPDPPGLEDDASASAPPPEMTAAWAALGPEEHLDLKLLSLLEYQLTPDDVRLLARVSRRTLRDTASLVAEVETRLRQRDVKAARLRDELDSVWGWIVLRQRELQETAERLRLMEASPDSVAARRLGDRRDELEQALTKRMRQRARILQELSEFKMTTSYKDIALLLNSTVGTVCSRIFRLRQRLERRLRPAEVAS